MMLSNLMFFEKHSKPFINDVEDKLSNLNQNGTYLPPERLKRAPGSIYLFPTIEYEVLNTIFLLKKKKLEWPDGIPWFIVHRVVFSYAFDLSN